MTSETLVCSVLLPERFGAYAPCTFGTQPNGFLQSPLPVQFPAGFLTDHRAIINCKAIIALPMDKNKT